MQNLTEEMKQELSEKQNKYEKFLTEATSKNNPTALYFAASNGDVDLVKYLLEKNVAVDKYYIYKKENYEYKTTPLWVASQNAYLEVVELLIEYGADVDKPNQQGDTPLWIASKKGHLEVVRYLVNSYAAVDKSSTENTPLLVAAQYGRFNIVKYLVEEAKADIDYLDDQDDSALMLAAERGYFEIVKCLVENGADVEQANSVGDTALILALRNGYFDIASYLRKFLVRTANTTTTNSTEQYTTYATPSSSSYSSASGYGISIYNIRNNSEEEFHENLCNELLKEYDDIQEALSSNQADENREDLLYRLQDIRIRLEQAAKPPYPIDSGDDEEETTMTFSQ